MERILEWHREHRIEMLLPEAPYGPRQNFEYAELYADDPSVDDGHRPFRMFVQNPDGTVEFRGYLCLCGIFVDLKYNHDSYFRVGKCGVSGHLGCEVLLPQGVQAPYLLAPDYRDHVRDAASCYSSQTWRPDNPDHQAEWDNLLYRPRAVRELEEFLAAA